MTWAGRATIGAQIPYVFFSEWHLVATDEGLKGCGLLFGDQGRHGLDYCAPVRCAEEHSGCSTTHTHTHTHTQTTHRAKR